MRKLLLGHFFPNITDIGLVYGKHKDTTKSLVEYMDSDCAGDVDKRRSLIGYVFTLGGCTISWKSPLQSIITLSTIEVEYIAATEAVKEGIWL